MSTSWQDEARFEFSDSTRHVETGGGLSGAADGESSRSTNLGAGCPAGGLVVCGAARAARPRAARWAPQHRIARPAALTSLTALPPRVPLGRKRAAPSVARRPGLVGDESFHWADLEAVVAVVAEQWIDQVGNREPGRLRDRSGRAGELARAAAEALLFVDPEGHLD
jgi:hypothetical protein